MKINHKKLYSDKTEYEKRISRLWKLKQKNPKKYNQIISQNVGKPPEIDQSGSPNSLKKLSPILLKGKKRKEYHYLQGKQ